jgi:hypothetical protein
MANFGALQCLIGFFSIAGRKLEIMLSMFSTFLRQGYQASNYTRPGAV